MDCVNMPERRIPVVDEVDVCVIGAGPAGTCAAIAAARNGARTLLIERYGFLGGNLTAALVNPIFVFHNQAGYQIIRGIAEEIVQRLVAIGGSFGHVPDICGDNPTMTPFDPEDMKYVLLEMVNDAGVKLRLHSQLVEAIRDQESIDSVIVANKSGFQAIRAKTFIDATGDGDLAAYGGAEFLKGREGDLLTQPMTLMFRLGNVDIPRVKEFMKRNRDDLQIAVSDEDLDRAPAITFLGLDRLIAKTLPQGEFIANRERILLYQLPRPGQVEVNATRIIKSDGTDVASLTHAEIEGQKQARIVLSFLKKYVTGFEDSYIVQTAVQIGVRETRRIKGRYVLSEEDITANRGFPDGIAKGCFAIDIHQPDGRSQIFTGSGKFTYDIPYRCLLPVGLRNLLVAGRCISATHAALASIRVMATCMAIGQAAGTAAALAAYAGIPAADVDIPKLRETLARDGAVLGL